LGLALGAALHLVVARGAIAVGPEAALREAWAAYLRGSYVEAARALEGANGHPPAQRALGEIYAMLGRYVEAETVLRETLAAAERARGRDDPEAAADASRLGAVVQSQGRYAEAETLIGRACGALAVAHGVDHPDVADCLSRLAELAQLQGRNDEAERRYWQAYQVQVYLYGEHGSAVGRTLAGLGRVALAEGRRDDARRLFRRSLAVAERPARTNEWGRLDERDLRALHALEREQYAVRGQFRTRARESEHPDFARHFDHLAELHLALDRPAEAEAMLKRSIAIRERAFGAEHPELAYSLSRLGLAEKAQGDDGAALAAARRAAGVLARRIALAGAQPAYAYGERVRWRPAFLLLASLPQVPLEEAFAAIQNASLASAGSAPLSVPEVRRLLAPGEALLAAVTEGDEVTVAVVRAAGAAVHRARRADAARALERDLAGVRHVLLAADPPAPELAGGLPVTQLPSVNALARLPR
jgi:tetratricopeptide (TPR) repeat protein